MNPPRKYRGTCWLKETFWGRGVVIGACGVCSSTGGHEIDSDCWVGELGAEDPLLKELILGPHEVEGDFEVEDGVIMVADWFIVGVVAPGMGVEETFKQHPSLLGRQLEQYLPSFTQAQLLHEPVLQHLQHGTILQTLGCDKSMNKYH